MKTNMKQNLNTREIELLIRHYFEECYPEIEVVECTGVSVQAFRCLKHYYTDAVIELGKKTTVVIHGIVCLAAPRKTLSLYSVKVLYQKQQPKTKQTFFKKLMSRLPFWGYKKWKQNKLDESKKRIESNASWVSSTAFVKKVDVSVWRWIKETLRNVFFTAPKMEIVRPDDVDLDFGSLGR